tara:strand:+ start:67 stop:219 length:153 start_codon:yes stop_codon:yes gene_type:complete
MEWNRNEQPSPEIDNTNSSQSDNPPQPYPHFVKSSSITLSSEEYVNSSTY